MTDTCNCTWPTALVLRPLEQHPPRPVCITSLVPHCANRGGCVRPLESGLTSGNIHPLAYITRLEEEITAVSAALQDANEAS